nr:serine protease inhibitor dipetalogastin [Crassostrea gigas]
MDCYRALCLLLAVTLTVAAMDDPCSSEDRPVCGQDDQTYKNKCEAEMAGVDIKHEGKCVRLCKCPKILRPVCGENGVTYANKCLAECRGIFNYTQGPCSQQ